MKTLIYWLLLLCSCAAQAHKPSDSYLNLDVKGDRIEGRWDIALRDFDFALGLDADDDGAITWGELRTRRDELNRFALSHMRVTAGTRDCPLTPVDLMVDQHTDGRYAVLLFNTVCQIGDEGLAVDYNLFFDLDPQHRGLLRLVRDGATRTGVFAPTTHRRQFDPGNHRDSGRELAEFLDEGVWHIWIGYDHILFLLSLLLPAVMVRNGERWRRAGTFKASLWDAAKVVTAFTLAHSVTLSLAALGYVELPSRWVESAIAASVIAAALNNLWPLLHHRRAALAFAFGLVHGLGFAAVLSDLGLAATSRLWALLGFNLGVELGQLAIVAAFLPLAFSLSRFHAYEWAVLKAGSAGICCVAAIWLVERAFDYSLMAAFG